MFGKSQYNTNQFQKMEAQCNKTSLGMWLCQVVEGRVNILRTISIFIFKEPECLGCW